MGKAYWDGNEDVFAVRAPLTLGHSQLVLRADGMTEREAFLRASGAIAEVIGVFEVAFKKERLHEDPRFKDLARYTLTSGDYVKTLIFRVSAAEKTGSEFKVHLAPYFASHACRCVARFNAGTPINVNSDGSLRHGGLIGWLGVREDVTQVLEDDYEVCGPLASWTQERFCLRGLASELGRLRAATGPVKEEATTRDRT